jgi:DNA-binding XRE family transcriptional regulator
MNALTNNVQIIKQGNKPMFAVIPYDEYLALTRGGSADDALIPQAVVELVVKNNWNLLKAWRKHLGMSQKELAAKASISQPALSQMENSDNHQDATIEKLAAAMGLKPEQLVD